MSGLSPACRQCEDEKLAAVAAATGLNESAEIAAGIRSLSGSARAGASGVSPIARLKEARSRSSSVSEVATGHNPFAKSAASRRLSVPNGAGGSGAGGSGAGGSGAGGSDAGGSGAGDSGAGGSGAGGTNGGRGGKRSRKHRSRKHRSRKHRSRKHSTSK